MQLIGKRARFFWSKNKLKLENEGTFTAASKMKWLVIPQILKRNSKLRLGWVKNGGLLRF